MSEDELLLRISGGDVVLFAKTCQAFLEASQLTTVQAQLPSNIHLRIEREKLIKERDKYLKAIQRISSLGDWLAIEAAKKIAEEALNQK